MPHNRVVFSDVHYDKLLVGGNDILACAEQAISTAIKYAGTGPVFILGDLINKKNMQTDTLARFNHYIQKHKGKPGDPVFVVGGNHELTPNGNSVLDLVSWPDNFITVTKKPFCFHDPVIGDIFLVPYLHSEYEETIKKLPKQSIVMSHVLVDGASGRIRLSSDISMDIFKKFKLVVLGDVHKYQRMGNIVYCGNMIQTSYSDVGNKQGFLVLDDKANVSRKHLNLPELEPLLADDKADVAERMDSILNAEIPVTASLSQTEAMQVVKDYIDSLKSSVGERYYKMFFEANHANSSRS